MTPAKRFRVGIDESYQYFRHNSATNWTKTMTICTDVRLAENVIPQRGFTMLTRRCEAYLLRSERNDSNVTSHSLARW
jgi:hypothetical protein